MGRRRPVGGRARGGWWRAAKARGCAWRCRGRNALRAAVGASKLLALRRGRRRPATGYWRATPGACRNGHRSRCTAPRTQYLVKIPADRVEAGGRAILRALRLPRRAAAPVGALPDLPGLGIRRLPQPEPPSSTGSFGATTPTPRRLPGGAARADGVYDLADGDHVMRAGRQRRGRSSGWLFDCARGYVEIAGRRDRGAGERRRFWRSDGVRRAIDMSVQGGRAASHDAVVASARRETGGPVVPAMDPARPSKQVLRAERNARTTSHGGTSRGVVDGGARRCGDRAPGDAGPGHAGDGTTHAGAQDDMSETVFVISDLRRRQARLPDVRPENGGWRASRAGDVNAVKRRGPRGLHPSSLYDSVDFRRAPGARRYRRG